MNIKELADKAKRTIGQQGESIKHKADAARDAMTHRDKGHDEAPENTADVPSTKVDEDATVAAGDARP